MERSVSMINGHVRHPIQAVRQYYVNSGREGKRQSKFMDHVDVALDFESRLKLSTAKIFVQSTRP